MTNENQSFCTRMKRFMPFSLIMAICLSCNSPKSPQQTSGTHADTTKTNAAHAPKSRTALRLDSLGYQNIAEQDSTIIVDLMYAKPDNFTGKILYADLREGYLHPDAMKCLLKAQQILRKQHPECRLIVYDAARPMSVQQEMWDEVKGTPLNIYVSNPAHGGGLHNYGLAVDVSIVDNDKNPLPMGTPVDYMGKASHITDEMQLVADGIITEQERQNRLLLRSVMKEAGFRALPSEWWHFNYCSRATARENYECIK